MPQPYTSLLLQNHHTTSMSLLPMVDVTSVSKQVLMHCALFLPIILFLIIHAQLYYAFKVHLLSRLQFSPRLHFSGHTQICFIVCFTIALQKCKYSLQIKDYNVGPILWKNYDCHDWFTVFCCATIILILWPGNKAMETGRYNMKLTTTYTTQV